MTSLSKTVQKLSSLRNCPFFLGIVGFGVFYQLIPIALEENFPDFCGTDFYFIVLLFFSPLGLLWFLLAAIPDLELPSFGSFRHLPLKKILFLTGCGMVFAAVGALFADGVFARLGWELAPPPLEDYLNSGDWLLTASAVFCAVFFAPLAEEILFRKLIFGSLCRYFSPVAGSVVTSMLFAGAHFSVVQFAPLFLLGLVFQKIAIRYGVSGAILGHCLNNLFSLLFYFIVLLFWEG